jgi:hypothetical protein
MKNYDRQVDLTGDEASKFAAEIKKNDNLINDALAK